MQQKQATTTRRNLIDCWHCPLPVQNLKSGGGMGTSSITGTPCQSGEGKGHPRSRGDLDLTRLSVETSNHRLGLRWMLIGHCRWSPTIIGSIWGMVQPWHVTKAGCSTVLTFETATFWLALQCTGWNFKSDCKLAISCCEKEWKLFLRNTKG